MQDKHIDEHIFSQLAGTTAVRCTCGREFYSSDEANQHRWWHLELAKDKRITTEQLAIWNKALELVNKTEILGPLHPQTSIYIKDLGRAIQAEIDKIGGRE